MLNYNDNIVCSDPYIRLSGSDDSLESSWVGQLDLRILASLLTDLSDWMGTIDGKSF